MSDSNAFAHRLSDGLTIEQHAVLAYIDGYLLGRDVDSAVRERLHAAFPFLGELDDAEARRDA